MKKFKLIAIIAIAFATLGAFKIDKKSSVAAQTFGWYKNAGGVCVQAYATNLNPYNSWDTCDYRNSGAVCTAAFGEQLYMDQVTCQYEVSTYLIKRTY